MKILITVLLLCSITTFGQVTGVVKDSLTQKPIPYVSIWVENENNGTTSEENGEFTINIEPKSQKLLFSMIGYEQKRISVNKSKEVTLKPIFYQLEEVKTIKLLQTKEIEVGDSNNRFFLPENQVEPWILARKIKLEPNNSEIKYLKNILFFTKSERNEMCFRARVFKVNENGIPSEDLITNEIIVKTKKGNKRTVVDVSRYKIEVPEEGIIVGFESLLTEGNKYLQEARPINSKTSTKILNYGPHIMYSLESKEESFTYRNGKWVKQLFSKMAKNEVKVLTPAINVTLTN